MNDETPQNKPVRKRKRTPPAKPKPSEQTRIAPDRQLKQNIIKVALLPLTVSLGVAWKLISAVPYFIKDAWERPKLDQEKPPPHKIKVREDKFEPPLANPPQLTPLMETEGYAKLRYWTTTPKMFLWLVVVALPLAIPASVVIGGYLSYEPEGNPPTVASVRQTMRDSGVSRMLGGNNQKLQWEMERAASAVERTPMYKASELALLWSWRAMQMDYIEWILWILGLTTLFATSPFWFRFPLIIEITPDYVRMNRKYYDMRHVRGFQQSGLTMQPSQRDKEIHPEDRAKLPTLYLDYGEWGVKKPVAYLMLGKHQDATIRYFNRLVDQIRQAPELDVTPVKEHERVNFDDDSKAT